jgi:Cytochrome P460
MKIAMLYLICIVPVLAQVSYNGKNQMLRPENYREWIWLSSGYGTGYTAGADPNPMFHNVYVNPEAWHSFVKTGKWPDKTAFVLEMRSSVDKGSINLRGRFQGDVMGIEVHVKDEHRFPNKWAFFGFSPTKPSADMIPLKEDCYSCHSEHGALDTTFAQFYPTVREIATQKGTLQPGR